MALRFSCTCGKVLQVAEEHAGRSVRCPQCQGVLRALAPVMAPADAPLPAATAIAPERPVPPPLPPMIREEVSNITDRPVPPPVPVPLPEEDYSEAIDRNLDELEHLGLVNHAGDPVAEDDDFFMPAPREIGKVLSGHTTLKTTKEPWSWPARLAMILPVLVGSLVILVILIIKKPGLSWITLPIMAGWTLIVLAFTRFKHSCNYVGTEGVATFYCGGNRDNVTRTDLFLFRDAIDLRTGLTNVYVNGVYSGTNYYFTWTNEENEKVYHLAGQYWSKQDLPPAKSPYRFAHAAELAWSSYLARNMDRLLLDREGMLFFPLSKDNWVRLGSGVIRLKIGGEVVELDNHLIDKMVMSQGVITITEVGGKAGWFSSTGVHKIVYKDLANAKFFLFALEKLMGYRFV